MMKFIGLDPISAIAVAVISSYLTALVFGGKSKKGSVASVSKNAVRAGMVRLEDSLTNYIEEKDEEMIEKMKAVKKTGMHREVKPIKREEEKEKYEFEL